LIQSKVDTWKEALGIIAEDNDTDPATPITDYVKDIFLTLYGDDGITKYYDDQALFDDEVVTTLSSI